MSPVKVSLAAPDAGLDLVEEGELSPQALDQLFFTCFAVMLAVWAGGNLLLRDPVALRGSAAVGLLGAGVLFFLYTASRVTRSLVWGIIFTTALLWVAVYAGSELTRMGVFLLLGAATAFAAWKLRVARWQPALAVAMVAALVILGCDRAYTSFDMVARVDAGRLHQDTLFHASIAAMVKNYGVVSTGLNGLVETPYHHLSHVLMAAVSALAGVSVLEAYGTATWIVFAPLLLLSIVATASLLTGPYLPSRQWALWVVAALALGAFPDLFSRWAFWPSFLTSESYLVSLILFCLGLGVLFTRALSWRDLAAVLLLTVLMSASKASVGLMFAGLWLVRALFLPSDRRLLAWLAAVGSLAAAASTVWSSAQASSGTLSIQPLHFVEFSWLGAYVMAIRASLAAGTPSAFETWRLAALAVLSFAAFHFLPSWIVLFRAYCRVGARRVLALPLALYCAAAAGAGMLVTAIFGIPGGSAYYFTNVAFFVALPVLVARAVLAFEALRVRALPAWMFAAVAATVMGASALQAHVHRARAAGMQANPLVQQLRALRDAGPGDEVLRARPEMTALNPVKRCTARPFLFPAVSERPWQDVIEPAPVKRCAYVHYGYERYGLSGPLQEVSRPAVAPAARPGFRLGSGSKAS